MRRLALTLALAALTLPTGALVFARAGQDPEPAQAPVGGAAADQVVGRTFPMAEAPTSPDVFTTDVEVDASSVPPAHFHDLIPRVRPLIQAELSLVRNICSPTNEQLAELFWERERVQNEVAREWFESVWAIGANAPAPKEGNLPRRHVQTMITDRLTEVVKANFSPELASKYRRESEKRAAVSKRVTLMNLVALLDDELVLDEDQRTELMASLAPHWDDHWRTTVKSAVEDPASLPIIPDAAVEPILTDTQKRAWRKKTTFGETPTEANDPPDMTDVLVEGKDEEDEAGQSQPPAEADTSYSDADLLGWIFESRSEADGRVWFETQLALHLEELDRACTLGESQKLKLGLAGRGDMKRFYDLLEQTRTRFHEIRRDEEKIQEIFQEIQPLRLILFRGPFCAGSIFAKTLRSTLSPEQAAKYERLCRSRAEFQYRATLELLVNNLDEVACLTQAQRTKLTEVIAAASPSDCTYDNNYNLLALRAAKLPDAMLQPIFDPDQWATVRYHLDRYKDAEPLLNASGILLDEKKDSADAEAVLPEKVCGPGPLPEEMP